MLPLKSLLLACKEVFSKFDLRWLVKLFAVLAKVVLIFLYGQIFIGAWFFQQRAGILRRDPPWVWARAEISFWVLLCLACICGLASRFELSEFFFGIHQRTKHVADNVAFNHGCGVSDKSIKSFPSLFFVALPLNSKFESITLMFVYAMSCDSFDTVPAILHLSPTLFFVLIVWLFVHWFTLLLHFRVLLLCRQSPPLSALCNRWLSKILILTLPYERLPDFLWLPRRGWLLLFIDWFWILLFPMYSLPFPSTS
jgi:hypothetical protein